MKPYYEDAACTIYHADCFDVLPLTADVVLTDPPFGIGYSEATWADDPAAYGTFMRSWLALTAAARCHFVWQAMPNAPRWHAWFPDDFRLFAVCKTFVQMRPTSPQWAWDPVIYWGKLPKRKRDNRDWMVSQSSDFTQRVAHPSPRRLDVVKYLVNLASEPGEVLLDPFVGSGTTLRAAKDLGRKAIGIDIEERYCEIAAKSLAQEVLALKPAEIPTTPEPTTIQNSERQTE